MQIQKLKISLRPITFEAASFEPSLKAVRAPDLDISRGQVHMTLEELCYTTVYIISVLVREYKFSYLTLSGVEFAADSEYALRFWFRTGN